MPKVFVSHTHDTEDYARRLSDALRKSWGASVIEGAGLPVGRPFEDALRDELELADYLVVLLSSRASESPWILFELGAAWGLNKPVVSVLLGDVDADRLDYLVRDRWYLDARGLKPEQTAERIKELATTGRAD